MAEWQNRIVGSGEVRVEEILAHPDNWRIHPKEQQDALLEVLGSVGWVQQIVINRTTGRLVDGHLRVLLADREGEETVPALLVELTEEEERKVLATLDPIAALAVADKEKLTALLEDIPSLADEPALQSMLRAIAKPGGNGTEHPGTIDSDVDSGSGMDYEERYGVIIMCSSEPEQAAIYERFVAEGFRCRVVAV
jgi:ParB-like chromosome segregation protein Spo0J